MLWDIYQQAQIGGVQRDAERAQNRANSVERLVERVDDRVDRLVLINMAMWSLLKEHLRFTEQQLIERVEEIDLSDGKLDGKVRVTTHACPQCNRNLSKRHRSCMYCGHEVGSDGPGGAFGGVS